ncbi:MAG: LPS export ABC transporter ATP-binding protein [Planctomycetaceae bacterium]|nr:LPS export ABC transporter ATP-binding protein [Planctomycetaceae bacterium]|tara:strand:+ start:5059 stop:5808 length:750 start_codon:yes stop_codon:yes gene_type:complete
MSILEVSGLVKTFGRKLVVNGVSFSVESGEIVGLLGPNGAGKTTTFKMTCGMERPDEGTVAIHGRDVTDWPMYRRAREGQMGYLPQDSSVFAKLSVEQNLNLMIELQGITGKAKRERCRELLERFNITHIRKTKAGRVSGGERRRLEIARCLILQPEIIMLDEPFAGIDPVTIDGIQKTISELRASEGISFFITDHAAIEILEIVDRVYVIDHGEFLFDGTAEDAINDPGVKEKYLGNTEQKLYTAQSA